MQKWMNRIYFDVEDDGDGGELITDEPVDVDDLVVVDELPDEDVEDVDTGGRSLKEIIDENARLKVEADQGGAIQRGIADLGTVLKQQQPAPANVPVQQAGESKEEFDKRFNKEFFGDNPKAVFDTAVERATAPLVNQLQQGIAAVNKKLYRDDPIYKEYGDEVEQELAKLTPQQRALPEAMEWALKQVKGEHIDDIIEKKINEKLSNTQVSSAATPNKKGTFVEGGGSRGGGGSKSTFITKAEKLVMETYISRGLSRQMAKDKVLRDRR